MEDELNLEKRPQGELMELRERIAELEARNAELLTDSRKTEKYLKESEERYRKLIGEVTDYIYIVQVENGRPVKTIHGPGCASVTGYISEEYEADPFLWINMVHDEDKDAVKEQAGRALAGEAVYTLEHRIIHKDGTVRWVRNTAVPRYDDHKRLIAYDGLISDITVRKEAEEVLRRSEEKIRYITASIGEGVYVLNEHGYVIFMNPEAKHLLGWTEAELLNRDMHAVMHFHNEDGSEVPLGDCPIYNVLKTGERYFSDREVFKRKDGTVFPVWVTSTPLMAGNKIVGAVTVFRDVTKRRQMEEERERLITELQKALSKVKTLSGLLPICASCKKIRDDKGYWTQIEAYIRDHSEVDFSHSICPECAKKMYPGYYEKIWGQEGK